MNIIIYETIKFNENDIVTLVMISFSKKIIKPIAIDIKRILKKFSFLLNLPENPIIVNESITKNKGFKISDK